MLRAVTAGRPLLCLSLESALTAWSARALACASMAGNPPRRSMNAKPVRRQRCALQRRVSKVPAAAAWAGGHQRDRTMLHSRCGEKRHRPVLQPRPALPPHEERILYGDGLRRSSAKVRLASQERRKRVVADNERSQAIRSAENLRR